MRKILGVDIMFCEQSHGSVGASHCKVYLSAFSLAVKKLFYLLSKYNNLYNRYFNGSSWTSSSLKLTQPWLKARFWLLSYGGSSKSKQTSVEVDRIKRRYKINFELAKHPTNLHHQREGLPESVFHLLEQKLNSKGLEKCSIWLISF